MAGRLTGLASAVVIALGAVTSSAVAAATSTDESQIRQVVAAELTALRALDPTAYAQNFCAEHHDAYEAWVQRNITPPPFEDLEGANPKRLTSVLRKNFPTVSDTAIQAFLDAATEGDREAYRQAWRGILREEFSHYSYRVRQVQVTGDQAEVTVQATLGKASGTVSWQFLRESGDWTDCTAPPATSDSAAPSLKGVAPQGLLGEIGDVRAVG
ncbi:hypothetical protein DE4585_03209 [Mycobacteroides salmoniphilum]|uniref:SnoaL-like domain protein n=1 Tax=Mycobacteroides salmoniphilum TaxID=404941 RepID=A0A4R8S128_9MYCO|nr:hypothetical protein [Mycobacteroides salmoniphilum]TDZ79463.1 hypothetical protein DE4585_03209 [Mycobacteroides salmoniphilum]TDZ81539.1 hypothetical protein DE4586_01496 [Mycobacteroides salmoniphilum]TDZ89039.1 hypothetical protein DE4587_01412 [Mycobacteroides salmoniphilum]